MARIGFYLFDGVARKPDAGQCKQKKPFPYKRRYAQNGQRHCKDRPSYFGNYILGFSERKTNHTSAARTTEAISRHFTATTGTDHILLLEELQAPNAATLSLRPESEFFEPSFSVSFSTRRSGSIFTVSRFTASRSN